MKKYIILSLIFVFAFLLPCKSKDKEAAFSIKVEKYTLENGLTVVLHEDKSDPIAAVAVYYHVGS